jgi:hypothetical protein
MHVIRLGVTHSEIDADYGLRSGMQLSLRLPYDIKDQHVRYTTLDGAPFVPPYGDIHHRTETLKGLSDPAASLGWSPAPGWLFGIGTTLPVGKTVADPIALGREGKKHEHLQFGSGTFEPDLSVQWLRPGQPSLTARVDARLSLYESSKGYRGPTTYVWSAGPGFRVGRVGIAPSLNGQYQTLARWHGEVEEGSGFNAGGIRLQASIPVGSVVIAPGVYREIWSKGFAQQSFQQGTTWSLGISRTFP